MTGLYVYIHIHVIPFFVIGVYLLQTCIDCVHLVDIQKSLIKVFEEL